MKDVHVDCIKPDRGLLNIPQSVGPGESLLANLHFLKLQAVQIGTVLDKVRCNGWRAIKQLPSF